VLVEEMLFRRLKKPGEIQRVLAPEFGVSHRIIRSYLKRVRERAAIEAEIDPDRLSRLKLTESIVGTLNMAMDKVKLGADGRPIIITVNGKPQTVPDPDLRTALRCQQALIDLHGLRAPQRHELTGKDGAPLHPGTSQAEAERLVQEAIDRVTATMHPPSTTTEPG
jgi:hypothetical protein